MSDPSANQTKTDDAAPTKEELSTHQVKFFRQAKIDGQAIQRHLAKTQVLVLGAGAIGSYAIDALAGAGVGHLHLLDAAKVSEEDVPANALLSKQDIGSPRDETISAYVTKRNPSVSCQSVSADTGSIEKLGNSMRAMDCIIMCLDSPAPAMVDAVNEAALQTNKRWLIGQVYQGVGLIGPTVIPRQTACYKCYELRRIANLVNYEEIMQYESRLRQMPGIRSEFNAPHPFAATIGGLVALEALRLLSGVAQPQTIGRLLRINFFAPEMTYHRLLRVPNCPACGYGKQQTMPQILSGK